MKKQLVFDATKRMLAIVLCALISVAYLPVSGLGIAADSSWAYANGEQEGVEKYDLERDRTMLIYWDGYIQNESDVYVENDDYPDGEWLTYEVTDVEVIANNPDSGDPGDQVVRVGKDYEDEEETSLVGWRYEAWNLGTATIEVSYTDIDNSNKTYEFTVTVVDELYEVYLDTESGTKIALPGESLKVIADFAHARKNYEEEGGEMIPAGDSWDDNSDGMSFSWELLDDGAVYASLQDAGDGKSAEVTFEDPIPNDEEWKDIIVKCTVTNDDRGDVVAEEEIRLTVANSYQELRPHIIDLPEVGDSATVKPELVIREKGEDDFAVPDVLYRWEYDGGLISVSEPDANGNYTITRIAQGEDETSLRLFADWTTLEGDKLTEEREYIFWSRGYDFHFDNYDWDTIYSDGDRILGLIADDDNLDLSSDDYSIAYTVGTGDYNDEDEFEFVTKYTEGTEYTISQEGTEITLIGDKLFEKRGEGPIYVRAELKKNGYVLGSCMEKLTVLDTLIWVDGSHDRDMLIGWDDYIREETAHFNTTALEGDWDYIVKKAEIKEQQPKEKGKNVIKLEQSDSEEGPYRIEALNYGRAVVEVSYTAMEYSENEETGATESESIYDGTFSFNVNVSDVVWRLNIDNDGSDTTLPGGSVNLHAFAGKDTEKDGWQPVEEKDLIYYWYLDEWADGLATIDVDQDHPSEMTFTVNDDIEEDYDFFLHLAIYDKEDTGQTNKLCESTRRIEVRSSYTELWPVKLNGDLVVGDTIEVDPEVRQYPGNENTYDAINGVKYTWYFDPDVFEICLNDEFVTSGQKVDVDDPKGFEIKRISNSESTIKLQADWEEGHLERDYDFWEQHYGVWFEDADPWVVFTDGSKSLTANIDGFEDYKDAQTAGYSLEFEAGFGYDFDNQEWDTPFTEDTEYSVDGNVVTIDGTALDSDDAEQDVIVIARLKKEDSVLAENNRPIYFKQAHEDYNLPQDRSMLPGWDGWISEDNNAWVENTSHPRGEDIPYTVTGVSIASQTGDAENPVVKIEGPDDNGNWRYVAENHGDATIKIDYKDVNNQDKEATFNVYVSADVYGVDIETESGTDKARPGDSVTLIASSWHEQSTQEGNVNVPTDNVTYDWQSDAFNEENGEYATLTPSADGSKAVLKFNDLEDMPEDIKNGRWMDFRIELILFDGEDDDNNPIERARSDIQISLCNEYYDVAPYTINSRQQLGTTQEVTVELRKFPGEEDEEYSLEDNAHFRWYYDPNVIKITDAEGTVVGNNQEGTYNYIDSDDSYGKQVTFYIERLKNSNTGFSLCVDRKNDNGDWEEATKRDYWLDELDYNIQFNKDNIDAGCGDKTASASLDKRDVDTNDDLSIEYEVGVRNGDTWSNYLAATEDYVIIDGLVPVVTIKTDKVLEKNIHNVAVRAVLKYKDEVLRDSWAWINLQDHNWGNWESLGDNQHRRVCANDHNFSHVEIEDHKWDGGEISTPATEDEAGEKTFTCEVCNATRTEVIPQIAHTHGLTAIPAILATCEEAGNSAYWVCDQGDNSCGKYFSDENGTEEMQNNSWIIPALGHRYGDWTQVDNNQHQRVCEHDPSHVEKEDHNWNDGEVTTPATCTEDGVKTYTCSVCGGTKTETIPATNHAYGEWTNLDGDQHQRVCANDGSHVEKEAHAWESVSVIKDATEEEEGEELFACTVCGAEKTQSIPKLVHAHRVSKIEAKEPTCEEDGNDAYWVCDQGGNPCGRFFSDEDATNEIAENSWIIDKLNHNYGEWTKVDDNQHKRVCTNDGSHIETEDHNWDAGVVTTPATCKAAGEKTFTCTKCDATKTEPVAIDQNAHSYGAWTKVDDKQHKRVCEHDSSHVETADHTWNGGEVTTPATCKTAGEKTFTCTGCGATRTEAVDEDPDAHNYGAWTKIDDKQHQRVCEHDSEHKEVADHTWDGGKVTTPATEKAEGVKTFTCTACKATKTESIAKLKPKTKPTGKVTILNTIANSAKKQNDVIWDKSKVKDATHYEIQWKKRGTSNWSSRTVGNVVRGTTTGLTIKGLYDIRVRPKNSAGYGAWSNTVYRYFHTTEKIRLASKSKGSFTMSWKKNPEATGYQVLYTTNKNGSGAAQNIKTAGASATSITVNNIKVNGKTQRLKSGTTYYVQIREIKKVGNTTYIGNISCPVAVKVK